MTITEHKRLNVQINELQDVLHKIDKMAFKDLKHNLSKIVYELKCV